MSRLHPITDSLVGTTLGDRYQLVRCLGQGSMGVVFEALQQPLDRRCAVKVLLEQLRDNQKLHQRFMREARAVSVLNHPNLVTLYDFGFAPDGRPYLVMEFIEGDLLAARIPYDGMPMGEVVQIIAQALLGLDHVHRHGIIHRDLKPENIALLPGHGQGPHVKILDFGLAKIMDNDGHVALTMTGEVYGTPYYMSPEQGTGSSQVTEAVDIYSLGVILFEMLTGAPPYVGKTPVAIISGHVRSPVPPLKPRAGLEVSTELNELVRRCLAKTPQERFGSARQMLDALTACPEGRLLPVSLLSSLRRDVSDTASASVSASVSSPAQAALRGVEVERPTSGSSARPPAASAEQPASASLPPLNPSAERPSIERPVSGNLPPLNPVAAPQPASQAAPQAAPAPVSLDKPAAPAGRPSAPVLTASPPITKQALPNRAAAPVAAPAPPSGGGQQSGAVPAAKPPGLSGGAPKGMLGGPSGLLANRPLSSPKNPAPASAPQAPQAPPADARPQSPPQLTPAARPQPGAHAGAHAGAHSGAQPVTQPLGVAGSVSGPQPGVARSGQSPTPTLELSLPSLPRPLTAGARAAQPQAALQALPSLLAGLSPGGKLPGFF